MKKLWSGSDFKRAWNEIAIGVAQSEVNSISNAIVELGWREWIFTTPPEGCLIEVFRSGWERPVILVPEELLPEANICGLFWRLTGIGKEQLQQKEKKRFTQLNGQHTNYRLNGSTNDWILLLYGLINQ